jgi:hypothetical protein
MLGFVKRLSHELRTVNVLLVRPKLEYASFVFRLFYYVHVNRIERMQRNFVRYALRGLVWMDLYNLVL